MRFLPLIGFSCFTVATLFTRCVFDPSPFLFFLFSGADSFVLVPLDRDRFAVAIVNRATALIFYSSLSSVLCCIICVFYDTLIKEETYSFLTSIFILFSGFVFSLFVWLFDLRFLPFSLAFYSSGASNASSTAERRDLPTTLFSILADSYDTVFVFCFIFSLFIVFSFFYSPLSSVGAR